MKHQSSTKLVADALVELGVSPDVEAAPRGRPRQTVMFDNHVGVGVRIYASGRRIYVAQARMGVGGKQRTVTIGSAAVISENQAIQIGRRITAHAMVGNDPASMRKRERQTPTFRRYLDEYWAKASLGWKASTLKANDMYRRHYLDNAFEGMTVDAIDTQHVARWYAATTDRSGPGGATRCLSILNHMMNKAEAWGYRPVGSNPANGLRRNRKRKCERFLSSDELARLGAVLEAARAETGSTKATAATVATVLLLTGCRRNEIADLATSDVHGGRLKLRDAKCGPRTVWLGDEARAVLAKLPRRKPKAATPSMFTTAHGRPMTGKMVGNYWTKLREDAGLSGVRLHDLRHTFASHAAMTQEALPMIGKLLGHSSVRSTARYAHLDDDHALAAAERIGAEIAAMMRTGR